MGYVIGVTENERLPAATAPERAAWAARLERAGSKQRQVVDLRYGARKWDRERRLVTRGSRDTGDNPRFVVANLDHDCAAICETIYPESGSSQPVIAR